MDIQDARRRLQQIDGLIRFYFPPRGRNDVGFNETRRSLTLGEWELVKGIILEHEFPCEVRGAMYGFSFSVRDRQDYLHGESGEVLLVIEHTQFPFPVTVDRVGGHVGTLRALEPLVYRARNHELLDWYGLPPLEPDITRYAY